MHEPFTHELERSPAVPSLAAQAQGLVAEPDRRRPGRQRERRQPMDGAGPQGRSGSPPALPIPGCATPADRRTARPPALLQPGAEAYGFRGQVWTRARVAVVIRLAFGVSYHPVHVGRLLKAIRWSPQKPVRRARQRDEAAIAHWRQETWPALKGGRRPRAKASSLETNRAFIPCPAWSGRMPP